MRPAGFILVILNGKAAKKNLNMHAAKRKFYEEH